MWFRFRHQMLRLPNKFEFCQSRGAEFGSAPDKIPEIFYPKTCEWLSEANGGGVPQGTAGQVGWRLGPKRASEVSHRKWDLSGTLLFECYDLRLQLHPKSDQCLKLCQIRGLPGIHLLVQPVPPVWVSFGNNFELLGTQLQTRGSLRPALRPPSAVNALNPIFDSLHGFQKLRFIY